MWLTRRLSAKQRLRARCWRAGHPERRSKRVSPWRACLTALGVWLLVLPGAASGGARPPLKVLFVGNSLTYYHAMPGMVADWAQEFRPVDRLEVEMLAEAGARLRQHLQAGELRRLLKAKRFDVVVFQELGGFPDCPSDFPGCRDSQDAMREIVTLIRQAGARPLWYATYTDPKLQRGLSQMSARTASALKVEFADTGAALARYARDNPGASVLDANDGMHPTPLGSWILAASLAHALFPGRSFAGEAHASCGPAWQESGPKLSSPASAQRAPAVRCFGIVRTKSAAIDAAVIGEGR